MFTIELGARVKDVVTGFTGVVMGRAEHTTGCNTYGVFPVILKDGMPQDHVWFDEHRLKIVGQPVVLHRTEKQKPGGPCYRHQNPPQA